jgi:hypothetical protein
MRVRLCTNYTGPPVGNSIFDNSASISAGLALTRSRAVPSSSVIPGLHILGGQTHRTRDALMLRGYERWLRRLIVGAAPDTLSALPNVDDLVARALTAPEQLNIATRNAELIHLLRPSCDKISTISEEIGRLSTLKDLHEGLHNLYLKLAFRSETALDSQTYALEIVQSCAEAQILMPAVGPVSGPEIYGGIRQIELCVDNLKQAIIRADQPGAQASFDQIQRLIRINLSGLNKLIFDGR